MNLWTRLQSFLSRFKAIAVDPEVNQRLADVDDELDRQRIVVDLPARKFSTPDRYRDPYMQKVSVEIERMIQEQR